METELSEKEQKYKSLLLATNVSYSFQKLLQDKIGSEEVTLTTICQFSKLLITIPVRHAPINYIHCVFEMDAWIEYYMKNPQHHENNSGFSCPGCRKYTNFKDYGVDYGFYHILEEIKLFKKRNPYLVLNETFLVHSPSLTNPIYYVETRVKKNQNAKIKILVKRYIIPGAAAVLGVQRKQKQIANPMSSDSEQRIGYEMSLTMVKLQQLIHSRIYRALKSQPTLTFETLQQRISSKTKQLCISFSNSMKLISLGKQSLRSDYVFALKKIQRGTLVQSIVHIFSQCQLIVYMIHYGIWHEYPLKLKGNPYVQLEQALYIKGEGTLTQNQIYVVGGQKEEKYQYSNQFLVICFPKQPFQDGQDAIIKELQQFPQDGYNFMGSIYRGILYIFYGQKLVKNYDNRTSYQLYNTAYAFKNNKWEKLNVELVKRFDGSFFTITHPQLDKLIVFFGGVPKDPDGLYSHRCPQQHKGQIFVCREEKFFGATSNEFTVNFSKLKEDEYQKSVLCTPVFTAPYYGTNQLILSGQYLKHNCVEKREIYTFDWALGELKLSDIFSIEPPEQILTPYSKSFSSNSPEIFTPVQDTEGQVTYGCYYSIYQYETESTDRQKKIITQLLNINLTNGLFQTIPFQDHAVSIVQAKQIMEKLEDRENIAIN